MKILLLLHLMLFILSGCITIYKEDLTFPKNINTTSPTLDISVGDEELENGSVKKISTELKEKIKRQVAFGVPKACSDSKKIGKIKMSFSTSYQPDGDCWLFNLCYLVWPAKVTGSHAVKFRINDSEDSILSDKKIVFRKYSHILLLPLLVFEPFDGRKGDAFLKLADSLSRDLCK